MAARSAVEVSQAHLEAAKLLEKWAACRGGFVVGSWNHRPVFCLGHAAGVFKAFYGSRGQLPRAAEDSPQSAECIGDDDYFLRENLSSSGPKRSSGHHIRSARVLHVDPLRFSRKRFACTDPETDLINKLPDELLLQIFRFLPRARDRAVCASVSMRWLMLQSHMEREEFFKGTEDSVASLQNAETVAAQGSEGVCDEVHSQEVAPETGAKGPSDAKRVERQPQWAIGDLSRCLGGKKATDVRLAAIAVGTAARGGLGKLSIRGGAGVGLEKGVTDTGLSAIGFCCSALRNLSLWNCLHITDEGLSIIGKGCRLLQKLDLLKCPAVGDLGVQSIAKNCPLLSSVSLEECALVGDRALSAIGEGCPELTTLTICNCPLVGDDGLVAVVVNSKKLKRMKLEGLRIGDKSLAFIGLYCKALVCLSAHHLDLVTEEGFILFCTGSGVQSLKRLSISSCISFTDNVFAILGNFCNGLKHLSLVKCERVSDQGLTAFVQVCTSLEVLQLERCNLITGQGLTTVFSSKTGKLREVQVRRCDGIQDEGILPPPYFSEDSTLKSVCVAHCRGVGNICLALVGSLCHHVTDLDLTGLTALTDEGLVGFLESGNCELTSVNFSGCVKLTDQAVCALAEQCGMSLRNLVLDGCKLVSDTGLKAIAKHCAVLEDLDVSQCSVCDGGVMALVDERGQTLSSLNLSGCGGITDKILPLIEKKCKGLVGLNLKHCEGLTRKVVDTLESRLWKCDVFCS